MFLQILFIEILNNVTIPLKVFWKKKDPVFDNKNEELNKEKKSKNFISIINSYSKKNILNDKIKENLKNLFLNHLNKIIFTDSILDLIKLIQDKNQKLYHFKLIKDDFKIKVTIPLKFIIKLRNNLNILRSEELNFINEIINQDDWFSLTDFKILKFTDKENSIHKSKSDKRDFKLNEEFLFGNFQECIKIYLDENF